MRPKERIKPFMEEITKLWEEVPDWRFGQLISNVLDVLTLDKFFLEDEETLQIFRNYFGKGSDTSNENKEC